jgi:hypothetical protein
MRLANVIVSTRLRPSSSIGPAGKAFTLSSTFGHSRLTWLLEMRLIPVDGEEWRRISVLELMYAALIRAAERWRGLHMTEFERRH